MDLIIFIIAIYGLITPNRLHITVAYQIVLATDYLGLSYFIKGILLFDSMNLIFSLLLFLGLMMKFGAKGNNRCERNLMSIITVFQLFLGASVILDLVLGVAVYDVISNIKLWLFLSASIIYSRLSKKDLKRVLKILLHWTVLINTLIIVDYALGANLLAEIKTNTEGLKRSIIPSTLTLLYFIILVDNILGIGRNIRLVYSGILLTVIVVSVIRSLILAVFISFALIALLGDQKSFIARWRSIVLILPFCLLVFLNQDVKDRFQDLFSSEQTTTNTRLLRTLVFAERFHYIASSTKTIIFGIGHVREENMPIIFSTGNSSRKDGKPDQLYSPDISWPNLIVRLGLLGTFIYLVFYFRFMIMMYKSRNKQGGYRVLFVYLFVNLFVISFASSSISSGTFWLLPFLLLAYSNRVGETELTKSLALNNSNRKLMYEA